MRRTDARLHRSTRTAAGRRFLTVALGLALILSLAVLLAAPDADATTAIAKREKVQCTACHDKPGSKLLTDEGLYYEVTGSVEGYRQVEGAFGQCTWCHVKEPGSEELTERGRELSEVVRDMEGLQHWILDSHPEAIREALDRANGHDAAGAEGDGEADEGSGEDDGD